MGNNKKFILTFAVMAGINIAGLAGWWLIFSHIQASRESILTSRLKIEETDRRINNSHALKNLLAEIRKDKEKIDASFLNSRGVAGFLEKLEALGRQAAVEVAIGSINLPGQNGISEPRFQAKASGSFRDLLQYFSSLENLPYQISFEKFSLIKPDEQDKNKNNWIFDFDISVLSYIP